jgi:predicted dienelactone hydrolase
MGPTTMSVAMNAPLNGKAMPMIVISHGTGGSSLGHFDTAIALADAGFVVVAMNHTGDNYADHSRSVDIMDRPRQVSRVIDHMLATWEGHAAVDPQRVGMFGHSAGGFTTLAIIGGVPDHRKIGPMCREYPGDFACQLVAGSASPVAVPATLAVADARIKAAVVAAPALGFTFSPDGLKNVRVPVQLWRAENDVVVPHPRYAEAVRLARPEAPDYHVVANAGHYDFLAPCSMALASIAPAICTSSAGFDRAAGFQPALYSMRSPPTVRWRSRSSSLMGSFIGQLVPACQGSAGRSLASTRTTLPSCQNTAYCPRRRLRSSASVTALRNTAKVWADTGSCVGS